MANDYEASLAAAKERLALQEAKIRQLQLMRAQIGKQRGSNANMCKYTSFNFCLLFCFFPVRLKLLFQLTKKGVTRRVNVGTSELK